MPPTSTPKLTKRQKKGIAFRERKGKTKQLDDLDHDVPILEVQDLAGHRVSSPEDWEGVQGTQGDSHGKGGRRETAVVQREGEKKELVVAAKKRKREIAQESQGAGEGEERQSRKSGVKRRKGDTGDVLENATVEEGEQGEMKAAKSKQRFILFLGNLKYTTTVEAIQAHFAACDPLPTVRLLAPKPAADKPSKPTIKSKGCAFLEFKHQSALQQGLRFHHSSLDGRRINVELTAGGGGKGETRLSKLKERNKELENQRRKRLQKKVHSQGEEPEPQMEGAKRFSMTSGIVEEVQKTRTWTVSDTVESTTRRGGKKHVKGGKARRPNIKDWSTGVNAIPVG